MNKSQSDKELDEPQPGTSKVLSYDQLNPQLSDISDDSPKKKPAKRTLKTPSLTCNFGDIKPKEKKMRGKAIEWKLSEEFSTEDLYKNSQFYTDLKEGFVKHRGPNKKGISNYVCRFAKKRVSF